MILILAFFAAYWSGLLRFRSGPVKEIDPVKLPIG
jgi:hypothetical protein